VYDGYMFGANACDVAIDVDEAFPKICDMTWCHQSQIAEWLPWVGRHHMAAPKSPVEWATTLRRRFERKNRELGLGTTRALELFRVTAWGTVPEFGRLLEDFPGVSREASRLDELQTRLALWREP